APDILGALDVAPQGVDGRPGRGQELMRTVELAGIERRDALGDAALHDLGILGPALLPGTQGERGGDHECQDDEDQADTRTASRPGPNFEDSGRRLRARHWPAARANR